MKKISIFSVTVLFWLIIFGSANASLTLCEDPVADNYNDSSECGCKYSGLFDGQQSSLCPSEMSIMVYQDWMGTDYCITMENGNKNWTKTQYNEFMSGLNNIYNLSAFVFYEYDACDYTPGEYISDRYGAYENGDCRIDGVNKFTFPPAPWDGTFVSNIVPEDLYWHFIGFMVSTEENTSPFDSCKQMFVSDDWTVFTTPVCSLSGDSDEDGICDDVDNCPDIANPLQQDADLDHIGDVCDPDTIYGTISGAVQGGVTIDINVYSCGTATTVATITTNEEGYYAVGRLGTDSYGIVPQYSDYVFSPKTQILRVPQTDIQSYDFTAIELPNLNSGLVAYYPFNGNADDESGNGNHGTVNGAVLTSDIDGNTDSAYSFDGVDDYIIVNDNDSLDLTTSLTIAVWINLDSYDSSPVGSHAPNVVSKAYSNYEPYRLELESTQTVPVFASSSNYREFLFSLPAVSLNQWTHLAVTYNNGTLNFYYNGTLAHTTSSSFEALYTSTGPLYIGARNPSENALDGTLDEIRIYNRALSEAEISELYNQ